MAGWKCDAFVACGVTNRDFASSAPFSGFLFVFSFLKTPFLCVFCLYFSLYLCFVVDFYILFYFIFLAYCRVISRSEDNVDSLTHGEDKSKGKNLL